MAGRRRLLLADITTSKARGKDLIKLIGEMNKTGSTSYDDLASGVTKKKNEKRTTK